MPVVRIVFGKRRATRHAAGPAREGRRHQALAAQHAFVVQRACGIMRRQMRTLSRVLHRRKVEDRHGARFGAKVAVSLRVLDLRQRAQGGSKLLEEVIPLRRLVRFDPLHLPITSRALRDRPRCGRRLGRVGAARVQKATRVLGRAISTRVRNRGFAQGIELADGIKLVGGNRRLAAVWAELAVRQKVVDHDEHVAANVPQPPKRTSAIGPRACIGVESEQAKQRLLRVQHGAVQFVQLIVVVCLDQEVPGIE